MYKHAARRQSKGAKGHENNLGQNHSVGGPKAVIGKNIRCFHRKKKGHIRSQCHKFKSWIEKKKNRKISL